MALLPGYTIWEYNNSPVLTVAASPLLSPWFDSTGYTKVLPSFKFTGGTSTLSIEGSWDGITLDADLTTLYSAPVTGTEFTVFSRWFRFKVVQTIADNTVTKIFLQSRA